MNESASKNTGAIWIVAGGVALCAALIWGGLRFPQQLLNTEVPAGFPLIPGIPIQDLAPGHLELTVQPFRELLKLVSAALLAIVVTYLNRMFHGDKPLAKNLEQAQILLCIAGAMMMIIIGNSLARALGVAGATSLIRFRTPVDDPKDAVLLILLISLGMALGLGAFAVAGLGAIFLCMLIWVLDRVGEAPPPRSLNLAVVADRPEFPSEHVAAVLGAHKIEFEPREVTPNSIKYQVSIPPKLPLEELSKALMAGGQAGVKSVSFETPKKTKRADD